MNGWTTRRRAAFTLAGLVVLSVPVFAALAFSPTPAAGMTSFADPAFQVVWDRSDRPVDERMAVRSWTWGPQIFYTAYEPYAEGPAGQHLVTYFDKSRMEINNPSGDRNSQWFVTNGLLVVEMISGRIQIGEHAFLPVSPAYVVVAGDINSPNAPTYAALQNVASLQGDHRAPNRTGQNVREGLGRDGNVGIVDNLALYSRYAMYEPTLGHNIPDVFWTYLNQQGMVYDKGQVVQGQVFDWLFTAGYPITEPYWININAAGQNRWVLMQAFQRRILTYSPQNAAGWQVEMGNVGRSYFDWRYKGLGLPPAPTPTPQPPASISISPTSGVVNTQVTVTGKNFPPYSAVSISIENVAAKYNRHMVTVAAKVDGTFSATFALPVDVNYLGSVTVAAMANGNTIRATQKFEVSARYNPKLAISPERGVPANGKINVSAQGFPAGVEVHLGFYFTNKDTVWITYKRTDQYGRFSIDLPVGNRPAGTTFLVTAVGGGYKAASSWVTVYVPVTPTPVLAISPNGVAVGQCATVTGSKWPANTYISIGLSHNDKMVDEWVTTARTDGDGNFSASFMLSNRWAQNGQILLAATVTNGAPALYVPVWVVSTEARVTPSGYPMVVYTYQYKSEPAVVKARAEGWPAGKIVNLHIVSGDKLLDVPVGSVQVRQDGTWAASIDAAAPWWGRRDLGLKAITADGLQVSVRYLPSAQFARVPNTGDTYNVTGYNWPANTRMEIVSHIGENPEKVVGTAISDVYGNFTLNVSRIGEPSDTKNSVEVRTLDDQYSAIFGF